METTPPHEPTPVLARVPREAISVLLVDDEAHARSYVRLLLRALGVNTVWEATNGEEALRLFQEHQPALVFLDNNMPVMSGRETMEQLRALDPEAAVVVVTSENDINTVRYFVDRGAIGYVLKHSSRVKVSEMIGEILDSFVTEVV